MIHTTCEWNSQADTRSTLKRTKHNVLQRVYASQTPNSIRWQPGNANLKDGIMR